MPSYMAASMSQNAMVLSPTMHCTQDGSTAQKTHDPGKQLQMRRMEATRGVKVVIRLLRRLRPKSLVTIQLKGPLRSSEMPHGQSPDRGTRHTQSFSPCSAGRCARAPAPPCSTRRPSDAAHARGAHHSLTCGPTDKLTDCPFPRRNGNECLHSSG